MVREETETLPDGLSEWITGHAEETGKSREEIMTRAVVAYRLAEQGEYDVPDPETVTQLEERIDGTVEPELEAVETAVDTIEAEVDAIEAKVDAMDETVSGLESELEEQISDIRERVVQVLREVQSKAAEGHSHPELSTSVSDLDDRLESQDDRLTDADAKLSKLASATVRLQRRVRELEGHAAEQEAAADLKAAANRHGTAKATCESCGGDVRVGLLSVPRCPHCENTFDGIEPKQGFFGTATLRVGDRPALSGDVESTADEPQDLFKNE